MVASEPPRRFALPLLTQEGALDFLSKVGTGTEIGRPIPCLETLNDFGACPQFVNTSHALVEHFHVVFRIARLRKSLYSFPFERSL
jgi:hypothetical protein